MRSLPGFLTLVLGIFMIGCGQEAPPPGGLQGQLTLTGSSTIAPLASLIAKRFEAQHPGVRIDVQTGGSSRGIADARSGLADIGMSSRALGSAEQTGVATHVLAQDGIGFVVHASNPVATLTPQQAKAIYTGQLTQWKEQGQADAKIVVINRAQGRSELNLVTDHFQIKPSQMVADVIAGENQQCVKLVAGNAQAIAYLSLGAARYEVDRAASIKLLTYADQAQLNRPLVLIAKPKPSKLAAAFLAYALSPQVHDLIEEQAFVPAQ